MTHLKLYDLDHTLVVSQERALYEENGRIHRLTMQEIADRGLSHDEVGWDEFMHGRVFCETAVPIEPMIRVAEVMRKQPNFELAIVTARQTPLQPELMVGKIRGFGLLIDFQDIYFSGDHHETYPEYWIRKQHDIRERLYCGDYASVEFTDDDTNNLRAFLELRDEFPDVLFNACHVDGDFVRYFEV